MRIVAFLLAAFVSSSVLAGEISIPAVYRGPGAEASVWRTEIAVANLTTQPTVEVVSVTITLHRPDGTSASVSMPLAPQETVALPDALASWFDVNEGGGLVRITWTNEAARITARARIYNVTEGGEYGQGLPGVTVDRLVTDSFLPGLTGLDGNRTNVGVSNPHGHSVNFWLSLYDTSGAFRGSFSAAVGPHSYRQFNDIFAWFQAGPLRSAMVRVQAFGGTVYPWASIVRNDSGDPTFVTPTP